MMEPEKRNAVRVAARPASNVKKFKPNLSGNSSVKQSAQSAGAIGLAHYSALFGKGER